MRILLTGAAGFIGYHAAQRFAELGYEVLGVDNFNAYYDVRLKELRRERLERRGIRCLRLELADQDAARAAFQEFRPEGVVHLAAQAGVRYSLENPHAYTRSNVEGFLNVLEGCRHFGVPRLVYASSSSVYGGILEQPFREDMRVEQPISLYAATKRANELMAHTYTHLFGFEAVGLRFFTVYGTFGRPDMALWLFTEAILGGRPIRVFNSGAMKRDFTYVSDIVQGVVEALRRPIPERHRLYNLGNHRPEPLEKLIALLEGCLGRKALREDLPLQPGDVPETFADIARARSELGFEPVTRLEDGVSSFTEWYCGDWLKGLAAGGSNTGAGRGNADVPSRRKK